MVVVACGVVGEWQPCRPPGAARRRRRPVEAGAMWECEGDAMSWSERRLARARGATDDEADDGEGGGGGS